MESNSRNRLDSELNNANQENDVNVDHYFLPGGILDTPSQREEDMIGGSLLDEIDGVGNIPLLPPTSISVSRILRSGNHGPCSEPRDSEIVEDSSRGHRRSTPIGERSIALSLEGTNPRAKEFTPSKTHASPEASMRCAKGPVHPPAHRQGLASDASRTPRAFSTAVGSQVKSPGVEHHAREIPGIGGGMIHSSRAGGQGALGMRAQDFGQQSGWPFRTSGTQPAIFNSKEQQVSPSMPMKHGSLVGTGQHRVSTLGVPPSGTLAQNRRSWVQHGQLSPLGHLQGGEFGGALGKHQGSKFNQSSFMPRELVGHTVSSNPGISYYAAHGQRRQRNQGPLRRVLPHEHSDQIVDHAMDAGGVTIMSSGQGGSHHETQVDAVGGGQVQAAHKSPIQNRIQSHPKQTERMSSKEAPTQEDARARERTESAFTSYPTSMGDGTAVSPVSHPLAMEITGAQMDGACEPLREESDEKRAVVPDHPVDNESHRDLATMPSSNSLARWAMEGGERSSQQVKSDEDVPGQFVHACKERDRTRSKKKEERNFRSGPKHILGAPIKESARGRIEVLVTSWQFCVVLYSSLRNMAGIAAVTAIKAIVSHLSRLRVFGRLVALLSLAASSGVSLVGVMVSSTTSVLVLGLRVHSLAFREATGSVHVAVCFLFPYFFRNMVYMVDEWAPHWLPTCLWYSFLMQMLCTSNHMFQHSVSSHLVPALCALLPVVFLCEVPSGRSYLLDLGESELLLLSFTLAAVRLRCLFSPIFLFSWSAQVLAIATFGCSSGIQYCQLLLSLASLNAISVVDVTLNSRFYHARYRAGMSLTSGFKTIGPAAHRA